MSTLGSFDDRLSRLVLRLRPALGAWLGTVALVLPPAWGPLRSECTLEINADPALPGAHQARPPQRPASADVAPACLPIDGAAAPNRRALAQPVPAAPSPRGGSASSVVGGSMRALAAEPCALPFHRRFMSDAAFVHRRSLP